MLLHLTLPASVLISQSLSENTVLASHWCSRSSHAAGQSNTEQTVDTVYGDPGRASGPNIVCENMEWIKLPVAQMVSTMTAGQPTEVVNSFTQESTTQVQAANAPFVSATLGTLDTLLTLETFENGDSIKLWTETSTGLVYFTEVRDGAGELISVLDLIDGELGKLPRLGSIDSDGEATTATISGGISKDFGESYNTVSSLHEGDTALVTFNIQPEKEHIDRTAGIVIAVEDQNTGSITVLDSDGMLHPLDELNPILFDTITLESANPIEVLGNDGITVTAAEIGLEVKFHVGYIVDGVIYANEQAVELTIRP